MFAKRILRLLPAVLCALCFAIPAMSQAGLMLPPGGTDTGLGGGNAITGTVLLATGQRLQSHATVRLQTMTKGDRLAVTDDNGTFSFRQLPNGEYTIVIDKVQDYETFRQTVEVRQYAGTQPQNYTMNIRLELKAGATAKPGVLNAELAKVPQNAVASYQKALQSAQAGKSKEAIDQLKQAISEYPSFMLAFNELGFQYLRLGELDKADEALAQAMKLAPDSATPRLTHGILLTVMRKFDLAVKELQAALAQKDQSANGHLYLGQALANLGRFAEAQVHLTRAVELGGDDVKDAHRFLGGIYLQRGEREKAVAEFETYLKLAPKAKDADQIRQMISQAQKSRN